MPIPYRYYLPDERLCTKCKVRGQRQLRRVQVRARRTKAGIRYSGRCIACQTHLKWVKAMDLPFHVRDRLDSALDPENLTLFGDVRIRKGGDLD